MVYPDFVDDLLAAQADAAKDIEKDFLKSVKVTVKETDWAQLERDLSAHADGDAIVGGVQWEDFDPKERLKNLFETCLEIDGEYIGKVTGGAKFDYVDPRALEWIEKYGAADVVDIDAGTKQAIRNIVREGYETGITPRNQARQIREIIGLDERRAETLRKYSENLFAKGLEEARVWELMEKKGRALLNARAMTIAVNETSEASANASYWSTKSACQRGVLDSNEYEGYRIITPDEHLCTRCSAIAGEARQIPDGTYESTGSNTAKVHTCCRCCEGLRSMKKKEMKDSGKVTTDIVFEAKSLKRKDGIIYCPTVPLVEGVFSGMGIPVLRLYEEFSKDAKWLNGLTVLTNHEELTPNARRIGQLSDTQSRPEKKDVAATTQFFEMDLTQREIENIMSRQPIHGSLSLSYNLEQSSGDWNGQHYEYIERGPYVFYEYSMVREGVVTPADGAGFNMECKNCNHNHKLQEEHDMDESQIEEMIEEAQKPLKGQIATLEQKITTLEGEQKIFKQQTEAKQEAEQKALFAEKLKPAFLEKAEEHWQECKKVGYLVFEAMHPEMIIKPTQERKLKGSAMAGEGGGEWDLEKERAKAKAEGKVI